MILTGSEIQKQIDLKRITIEPYSEKQLNPNSYNLRLHNELLVYDLREDFESDRLWLDAKEKNKTSSIDIENKGLILLPNVLYLGRTVEKTHTDYYVPVLSGRSSIGRLGINVHVTAGFGDVGFNGYWTLEIFVIHPTRIYADMEICQIYFNTIEGDVSLYKGKYQNNDEIQASEMWREL